MAGAGAAIEFGGTLAAKLLACRGLDVESIPEGSGQREATTVDDAFAYAAFARGELFNAGAIAGQGVFVPSSCK